MFHPSCYCFPLGNYFIATLPSVATHLPSFTTSFSRPSFCLFFAVLESIHLATAIEVRFTTAKKQAKIALQVHFYSRLFLIGAKIIH